MSKFKPIKTISGQSLIDVALQEYGAYEGVFIILKDNPNLENTMGVNLVPGTSINIRQEVPELNVNNKSIAQQFATDLVEVATGDIKNYLINLSADYDGDADTLSLSFDWVLPNDEAFEVWVYTATGGWNYVGLTFTEYGTYVFDPFIPDNDTYIIKLISVPNGIESNEVTIVVDNPGYLIDDFVGAKAAYSLRKLSASYVGAAIRIKRAPDNSETDIYFDGTGNLDTASILGFLTGFPGEFIKVVKWYDQSGNGKDLVQTTFINQPYIYFAGWLVTASGGKPAISYQNSFPSYFNQTDAGLPTDATTLLSVSKHEYGSLFGSLAMIASYGKGEEGGSVMSLYNGSAGIFGNAALGFSNYGTFAGIPNRLAANNLQLIFKPSGTGALVPWKTFVNDLPEQEWATNTETELIGTPGSFRVGVSSAGFGALAYPLQGFIQELVIWDNDYLTDVEAIKNNVNDYYGIY
jgi:hypothetical protein